MNLLEQVVSLELAKELKKLEVKQDSMFYWIQCGEYINDWSEAFLETKEDVNKYEMNADGQCSAYTVAELGEMLPGEIREIVGKVPVDPYFLDCGKVDYEHSYYVRYTRHATGDVIYIMRGRKEADVRAEMLIRLIKERVINVREKREAIIE
jgi:hypothetical protein